MGQPLSLFKKKNQLSTFEGEIGFTQQFMNQTASNLMDQKELQRTVEEKRFLKAESGSNKKVTDLKKKKKNGDRGGGSPH